MGFPMIPRPMNPILLDTLNSFAQRIKTEDWKIRRIPGNPVLLIF